MSQDVFTDITGTSSGCSRVAGSGCAMLIGIVMIPIAFVLLFWNEGRAVRRDRDLREGGSSVISLKDITQVNADDEGKLVHLSGLADSDEVLTDPLFGISGKAIRLERIVEMFQWVQKEESHTEKKVGGAQQTVTKYTYTKEWSPQLISSLEFAHGGDHQNPHNMSVAGEILSGSAQHAKQVRLGGFVLPGDLTSQIGGGEQVPLDQAALDKVSGTMRQALKIRQGYFYYSRDPAGGGEQIGDVRIHFNLIKPAVISVLGRQTKDSFGPYQFSGGSDAYRLEMGQHSAASMFSSLATENTIMTWVLRLVGFLLMFFGITLCFQPIVAVADVIPFFGDMVSGGIFLFAVGMAFVLTLCTLAAGWITYRPLVGVPLLLLAIGSVVGLYVVARKRGDRLTGRSKGKRRRQRDRADSAIGTAAKPPEGGVKVPPRATPKPSGVQPALQPPAEQVRPAQQIPPGMVGIRCPNCSATYTVPEAVLGKKTSCKKCQTKFVIERPDDEEVAVDLVEEDEDVAVDVVEEDDDVALEVIEEGAATPARSRDATPQPAVREKDAARPKRRKKKAGALAGSTWLSRNRWFVWVVGLVVGPFLMVLFSCGGFIWSLIPSGKKVVESQSAAAAGKLPDLDVKDVVGRYLLDKNQKCFLIVSPGGDIRVRDPDRIFNGGDEGGYKIQGHTLSIDFKIDPVINGKNFGDKAVVEVNGDKLIHSILGTFVRQPSPWAKAHTPSELLADLNGNGPLGSASLVVLGMMDGHPVRGYGISADGTTVVGEAVVTGAQPRPFRWTRTGGFIDLGWPEEGLPGSGFARAASADGAIIAGDAYFAASNAGDAARFDSSGAQRVGRGSTRQGQVFGLNIQITGDRRSSAMAISSDGSVLAGFLIEGGGLQAFRWSQAEGNWKLAGLANSQGTSVAYGISSDGQVVVGQYSSGQQPGLDVVDRFHAVRWQGKGAATALATAQDYGQFSPTSAMAISADGKVIVGTGHRRGRPANEQYAFRWTEATNAVPLDDQPNGAHNYAAAATSSDGSIVAGWSTARDDDRTMAAVWEASTGVHDLQAALQRDYGLNLAAWKLTKARGISADGRTIVGTAVDHGLADVPESVRTWVVKLNPSGATLFSKETWKPLEFPKGNATTAPAPMAGNESTAPGQIVKVHLADLTLPGVGVNHRLGLQLRADGKVLALADPDGMVHVWQVNPSKELATFKPRQTVEKLAFSSDGCLLAIIGTVTQPNTAHRDASIQVWDWEAGKNVNAAVPRGVGAFEDVRFSPDDKTLATIDSAGNVTVKELAADKGFVLSDLRTNRNLAFSPDGSILAAAGGPGLIRLINLREHKLWGDYSIAGAARCLAFGRDSKTFAWGGENDVFIMDADVAKGDKPTLTLTQTPGSRVESLTYSPDGKTIAVGNANGTVNLWDAVTGQPVASFQEVLGTGTTQVSFLSPNKVLVAFDGRTGGRPQTVKLWTADIPVERSTAWKTTTVRAKHIPGTVAPGAKVENLPDHVLPNSGDIEFTRFSPDGKLVALPGTGKMEGVVIVREVATGTQRAGWNGVGSTIRDVAFSSDNRLTAIGGESTLQKVGFVSLQDLAPDKPPVQVITGSQAPVLGLRFSPEGKTLAIAHQDGSVFLVETDTRKELVRFPGADISVTALAFAPDGSFLAVGGSGGKVRLIDIAARNERKSLKLEKDDTEVSALCFASDGKTLAVAETKGDVSVWDISKGEAPLACVNPTNVSCHWRSVALSPNGAVVAMADTSGDIRLWEPRTNKIDETLIAPAEGEVGEVHFLPDGKLLAATGGGDGAIHIRRMDLSTVKATDGRGSPLPAKSTQPVPATSAQAAALPRPGVESLPDLVLPDYGDLTALRFSPDGSLAAIAGSRRSASAVRVIEAGSDKERAAFNPKGVSVNDLAFSPDNRLLAVAGQDNLKPDKPGTVQVWALSTGKAARTLEGHKKPVRRATFNASGSTLATADDEGTVKLWEVSTWKEMDSYSDPESKTSALAFSPADSPLLAVGDPSGRIRLMDLVQAKELPGLQGKHPLTCLAFSKDGKTLAAGTDKEVMLWDLARAELQKTGPKLKPRIASLSYSPDGGTLAIVNSSGAVSIWNPGTGEKDDSVSIANAEGHVGEVHFLADGKLLAASGGHGGTAKLLRIDLSAAKARPDK